MKIRSAMGRIVDVGALMKENETVRAVSNIKINARGDRLDNQGNIIVPVQQVAKRQKVNVSQPITTSIENATNPAKAFAEEEKKVISKKQKKVEPTVVNIVSKTDEAGNTFSEIEYDDGSIEIRKDGDF